ncbi:hypothetical protein BXY64_2299 [Marinifilum flexuosum]|uniref:Uncharacterized protein n=1 Tax=Marinifilum flexuosum TaxID=1117708 RepID=A0A419X3A9_9BACT|nr:hypothetical protein BXY64_2299 [Marinifilum flexuosum]
MLILIKLISDTQVYLLLNHPLFLFSFFWFISIFLFLLFATSLLGREIYFLIPPCIYKVGMLTFSFFYTLSRSECLLSVSPAFFLSRIVCFFIPSSIFKVGLLTFSFLHLFFGLGLSTFLSN